MSMQVGHSQCYTVSSLKESSSVLPTYIMRVVHFTYYKESSGNGETTVATTA